MARKEEEVCCFDSVSSNSTLIIGLVEIFLYEKAVIRESILVLLRIKYFEKRFLLYLIFILLLIE